MYLKSIICKQINLCASILESFDNTEFLKGIYSFFKMSSKNYVTVFREPDTIEMLGVKYYGYSHVGIVIQGPVRQENGFTLETIRRFRNIYPDIKLVLSTWTNNLSAREKKILDTYKCYVIESEPLPAEYKGKHEKIAHLNNQIFSSHIGLEYLVQTGVSYAMKIRSDIRINKIDFIPYLLNTIQSYSDAHYKLINIAFSNSLYNVPFHMSDFIWFGAIKNMNRMYSIPYRSEKVLNEIVRKVDNGYIKKYHADFNNLRRIPYSLDTEWYNYIQIDTELLTTFHEEIYLPYMFWYDEHMTLSEVNLLSAYYNFLTEIIILDDVDLLVYWDKYHYSIVQSNYSKEQYGRLSHAKWLDIYLNYRGER